MFSNQFHALHCVGKAKVKYPRHGSPAEGYILMETSLEVGKDPLPRIILSDHFLSSSGTLDHTSIWKERSLLLKCLS